MAQSTQELNRLIDGVSKLSYNDRLLFQPGVEDFLNGVVLEGDVKLKIGSLFLGLAGCRMLRWGHEKDEIVSFIQKGITHISSVSKNDIRAIASERVEQWSSTFNSGDLMLLLDEAMESPTGDAEMLFSLSADMLVDLSNSVGFGILDSDNALSENIAKILTAGRSALIAQTK